MRIKRMILVSLGLAGCLANSDEVQPSKEAFFFPTGVAISQDQNSLFVTNANSNFRYDSGTITYVDLLVVESIANAWQSSGAPPADRDCDVDANFGYTLVCDESEVIGASVRTGNFATELGVQELDNGNLRVFAAVRGDPSLTWVDFDSTAKTLECGGSGGHPRCNEAHRLSRMRGDESIGNFPVEPFGIYVDSSNGYVVMTHLLNGAVSLADAPSNGDTPVLSDAHDALFASSSRPAAATGVMSRTPGGTIYVTSSSDNRIQTFSVGRVAGGYPSLVPADYFFLEGVAPSNDSRGIRFGQAGDVGYIINRNPGMLHVLDTKIGNSGFPNNELLGTVELCGGAANLAVGDVGGGEHVYVACFQEGQVWAIDPIEGVVSAIIDVGRGPQNMQISVDKKQLYVSNFLEDTVAVVDLAQGSITENKVVLKLGRTRQSGGN